jgi:predicted component of type VI protein secretion system
MDARLRIVNGPSSGEFIAISPGKLIVGREEDCHLRPASEFISRHHCVFLLDSSALRLRDLGSKNGTFVNGRRIASGEIALSNDDMVSIGELVFQIELQGATMESPCRPLEGAPAALLGTGIVDGETLRGQAPKASSAPTRSMTAKPAVSPEDARANAPHDG